MAQTRGLVVRPVAGSTTAVPLRSGTPRVPRMTSAEDGATWPTARTTVSSGMANPELAISTGRRRPEASGSPSAMRTKLAEATRVAPSIRVGAVSQRMPMPSSRASVMACGYAGLSAWVRR